MGILFVWLRRSHTPVTKVYIVHVFVKRYLVAVGRSNKAISNSVWHLSKVRCSPNAAVEQDGYTAKGHGFCSPASQLCGENLGILSTSISRTDTCCT